VDADRVGVFGELLHVDDVGDVAQLVDGADGPVAFDPRLDGPEKRRTERA
jgi:hypothetical protein